MGSDPRKPSWDGVVRNCVDRRRCIHAAESVITASKEGSPARDYAEFCLRLMEHSDMPSIEQRWELERLYERAVKKNPVAHEAVRARHVNRRKEK